MRRTGKTTLLRMVYNGIKSGNKAFLDLENPIERKAFEEEDYNNIWENLSAFGVDRESRAFVFLDEVQACPGAVKAVKYLHDHYAVKFFLTGSSSFYLKNLFPESLAGRKAAYELRPLDFGEFLVFRGHGQAPHNEKGMKGWQGAKGINRVLYEKTKNLYAEYVRYGGFPQVVLEGDAHRKREQISDIFKSYFEKDVKTLADFRQINAFRDLILLLLQRIGSRADISKLASEVGVTRETVYSYLSFLQGTYFFDLVPPYTRNVDREVSGSKKVYCADNGIASVIGRAGEGSLLENAVYLNLKKYGEVRYYQKRSGGEIDFVLPAQSAAIEVKSRACEGDAARLHRTAASIGMKNSFVVSGAFSAGRGIISAAEI